MSLRALTVFAFALGAAMAFCVPAYSVEPERPDWDTFIRRAIFTGNELWLLTAAGALFTIAEGKEDRVDIPLPAPALDLWRQGEHPAVITCQRQDCSVWAIRERISGEWKDIAIVPAEGDRFLAISADGAGLVLLSSRRIIEIEGERRRIIEITADKESMWMYFSRTHLAGQWMIHATPANIFAGLNTGEWGGGLMQIGRKTGEGNLFLKLWWRERRRNGAMEAGLRCRRGRPGPFLAAWAPLRGMRRRGPAAVR
jgi:hypothetical protein